MADFMGCANEVSRRQTRYALGTAGDRREWGTEERCEKIAPCQHFRENGIENWELRIEN
jgi:hypothetical protein